MLLAVRFLVALAVAGVLTFLFGTADVITMVIIFLPVFGMAYWLLGMLRKKDSTEDSHTQPPQP